MGGRVPGPTCQATKPQFLNDGTTARCSSPVPGPTKGRVPLTPSGLARLHGGMQSEITVEVDENELEMVVMTVEEFQALVVKPATEAKAKPAEKQNSLEAAKLLKHTTHTAYEMKDWVKIVREMGFNAQMRFQKVNGVDCVILSGRTGLRQILHPKAAHLKVGNPKVIEMVIGRAGLKHAALHSFKLGVILSAVVNTYKASASVIKGDAGLEEAISTYLSSQAIDVGKVAFASLASYMAGVALTATGIAVLPFAGAILIGVAVGIGLDYFFPTKELAKMMEKWLGKRWGEAQRLWEELRQTDPSELISLPPMAGFTNNNLPVAWSRNEKELVNALMTA